MLVGLAIVVLQFTGIVFAYKAHLLAGIFLMFSVYYFIHYWMFRSFHGGWWKVTGYSFLVQLFQAVTALLILVALDVEGKIMDYLFIFLLSCLAYVLPFIGAREMAFVFGADAFGLDTELSLAISLFFYLALAMTSLSGIYFSLIPGEMEDKSG